MPVPSSNPPVIRQIARIRIDPAPADSSPFVNVEAPSDDDGELAGEHVEPFRKEGLETEKIHEIRVAPLEKFEIRLRDEHDFPIPEADYQVTFSDLTVENGKLDLRGAAILWNPPPGPLEIIYPDLDDVKAKSLAGRVRKACATADLNELHKVLLYSPSLIELAAAAYKRYFDNLSGKGMAEDIQKSITNDMQLQAIQCLMALAGLPTWIPYRFKTAPVSEEVFA